MSATRNYPARNGGQGLRLREDCTSVPERALPDRERADACGIERKLYAMVPSTIPFNFRPPEFRSRSWQPEERAVVTMEETAVQEHCRPPRREPQIGMTRYCLCMQAIAQADPMQVAPDDHLQPGIL